MVQENPLCRRIREAWNGCREDYNKGLINSERSLQVVFSSALRTCFRDDGDKQSQILIEPHLSIDRKNLYPDIVVCDSQNVVGVIEIKYKPRIRPSFENDLRKLCKLCECKDKDLSLLRSRYRGPLPRAEFRVSKDVVLVWAGVHCASEKYRRKIASKASQIDNFLQLHLETYKDCDATVPDDLS